MNFSANLTVLFYKFPICTIEWNQPEHILNYSKCLPNLPKLNKICKWQIILPPGYEQCTKNYRKIRPNHALIHCTDCCDYPLLHFFTTVYYFICTYLHVFDSGGGGRAAGGAFVSAQISQSSCP